MPKFWLGPYMEYTATLKLQYVIPNVSDETAQVFDNLRLTDPVQYINTVVQQGQVWGTFNDELWHYPATVHSKDTYSGTVLETSATYIPNVSFAPEPVSSILFITGGATLGFRRFRKKRKKA